MEKIKPGKYVEITYDLYQINPDGTEKLVHQVDPEDPEKFVFGVTRGMIEPLEKALDGMEPGATYDVTAKADEAFYLRHRADSHARKGYIHGRRQI